MPASLDTLEPLIHAVQDGVQSRGWILSGTQKTTSMEFEGRWAGASTRSAYLFFHRDEVEDASVDVYLDETPAGLHGSLSLPRRKASTTGRVILPSRKSSPTFLPSFADLPP